MLRLTTFRELDSSERLYWKLHGAGATVRLRVWEGMGQAFESVPGLQEGEQNMREVFGFLEARL
jgi:acetyl esterase/lipase